MCIRDRYEITENIDETDVAFLNTCTVREGAATQIYGKLGELKHIREQRGLYGVCRFGSTLFTRL